MSRFAAIRRLVWKARYERSNRCDCGRQKMLFCGMGAEFVLCPECQWGLPRHDPWAPKQLVPATDELGRSVS